MVAQAQPMKELTWLSGGAAPGARAPPAPAPNPSFVDLLATADREAMSRWPAKAAGEASAAERLIARLAEGGHASRAHALASALARAEYELAHARHAATAAGRAAAARTGEPTAAELQEKLERVTAQAAQTERRLMEAQRKLIDGDASVARARAAASSANRVAALDTDDLRVRAAELGTELSHAQQLGGQQADTIREQSEHIAMLRTALDEAEAQLRGTQEKLSALAAVRLADAAAPAAGAAAGAAAPGQPAAARAERGARSPSQANADGAEGSAEPSELGQLLLVERSRREALEAELLSLKSVAGRQADQQRAAIERTLGDLEAKVVAAEEARAAQQGSLGAAVRAREEAEARVAQEVQYRQRAEAGWERAAQRAAGLEAEARSAADRGSAEAAALRAELSGAHEHGRALAERARELEGQLQAARAEASGAASAAEQRIGALEEEHVRLRLAAREAEVRLEGASAALAKAEARGASEAERARQLAGVEESERLRAAHAELASERRAREDAVAQWRTSLDRQAAAFAAAQAEVARQAGALRAEVDGLLGALVRASAMHAEVADWVRVCFELKVRRARPGRPRTPAAHVRGGPRPDARRPARGARSPCRPARRSARRRRAARARAPRLAPCLRTGANARARAAAAPAPAPRRAHAPSQTHLSQAEASLAHALGSLRPGDQSLLGLAAAAGGGGGAGALVARGQWVGSAAGGAPPPAPPPVDTRGWEASAPHAPYAPHAGQAGQAPGCGSGFYAQQPQGQPLGQGQGQWQGQGPHGQHGPLIGLPPGGAPSPPSVYMGGGAAPYGGAGGSAYMGVGVSAPYPQHAPGVPSLAVNGGAPLGSGAGAAHSQPSPPLGLPRIDPSMPYVRATATATARRAARGARRRPTR